MLRTSSSALKLVMHHSWFSHDRRNDSQNRRRQPTRIFSHYIFNGRRTSGRRKSDLLNFTFFDRYQTTLLIPLLLLAFLSIADALFTLYFVGNLGLRELNPLMNYLLRISELTFFITKYALTVTAVIVFCITRGSRLSRAGLNLCIALYLPLFIAHCYYFAILA